MTPVTQGPPAPTPPEGNTPLTIAETLALLTLHIRIIQLELERIRKELDAIHDLLDRVDALLQQSEYEPYQASASTLAKASTILHTTDTRLDKLAHALDYSGHHIAATYNTLHTHSDCVACGGERVAVYGAKVGGVERGHHQHKAKARRENAISSDRVPHQGGGGCDDEPEPIRRLWVRCDKSCSSVLAYEVSVGGCRVTGQQIGASPGKAAALLEWIVLPWPRPWWWLGWGDEGKTGLYFGAEGAYG